MEASRKTDRVEVGKSRDISVRYRLHWSDVGGAVVKIEMLLLQRLIIDLVCPTRRGGRRRRVKQEGRNGMVTSMMYRLYVIITIIMIIE